VYLYWRYFDWSFLGQSRYLLSPRYPRRWSCGYASLYTSQHGRSARGVQGKSMAPHLL